MTSPLPRSAASPVVVARRDRAAGRGPFLVRLPVLTSRIIRRLALRVLGDPFHPRDPDVRHPELARRRRLDEDAAAEERRALLLTRTGA